MQWIKDTGVRATDAPNIGGKAWNLHRLNQLGMQVPKWLVIPKQEIEKILLTAAADHIKNTIDSQIISDDSIKEMVQYLGQDEYFAVRSSAVDEDGSDFSFAGQFETYLYVQATDLAEHIKKVWHSAFSERVIKYRQHHQLELTKGIAVIVQQMVPAEVAGVAFGINPSNGDRKTKVISSVYGLGEGLVSGELDADTYLVCDDKIESTLAHKSHQMVFDKVKNYGVVKVEVAQHQTNLSTLKDDQIKQIAQTLDQCKKQFGKPQDIEFALFNNQLYLLQARPITNLHKVADVKDAYILWDNSNIIESYPGVTTPLTFSFIRGSYEVAYRLFSGYMGVDEQTLNKNHRVFANTLGLLNGRVYYNLRTWYQMLALLPGYHINARFMEKMMGVKERFDIPQDQTLSKTAAWWRIFKMLVQMYLRFKSLPRKRREFMDLLNATIAEYKAVDYHQKSAAELMELYLRFERILLNEWKAPLLNDFFAMVWFGLLQKRCEQYKVSENPNIHNDLLCGSSDIISTQPIHRSIDLATKITEQEELKKLFISFTEQEIWAHLLTSVHPKEQAIKKEIDLYIQDFGERCMGELKLETISYTQDPSQFVRVLKAHVQAGITNKRTNGKIEETLRKNAEQEVAKSLKGKWLKQWMLKNTLRNARDLVSSRENLRYERTRAFGIVRQIFSAMGDNFYSEGILDNPRDVFYLSKEEIFSFIEGTSVTQNLKALVGLRKQEFEEYKTQGFTSERLATYGAVYHANDFFSTQKVEKIEGDLKGIGCCPGRVKAKVRIVTNPYEINSLDGDILVTSSTDPGWVTLFPSASAIMVERGSLLSHSAIVSREMGIPCIVSVTGLLKTLKTGDLVEMDGSTGQIKIIEKAS